MQSKKKGMRENAIPEEAKNRRTKKDPTNSALDVDTKRKKSREKRIHK